LYKPYPGNERNERGIARWAACSLYNLRLAPNVYKASRSGSGHLPLYLRGLLREYPAPLAGYSHFFIDGQDVAIKNNFGLQ
jgi:hypothetical protein